MKAIEVKKGDEVIYNDEVCTIICATLNAVLLESEDGIAYTTSYSQIQKRNEPKQSKPMV